MPIIDFRYRPGTRESLDAFIRHPVYREYMKRTPFASRRAKTLQECVEELRGLDVVKAVYTGRDCESTYHHPASNDHVLRCMRAYPDFFVGFYGFDPHKKMEGLRRFRLAVEREGMRGASIEPCMAHLRADDARFYPLYTACCELNVPVIVTAGLSSYMPDVTLAPMAPRHIDTVARDFPELRILISHGGYPWMLEAVAVAQRNLNVHIDFSTCPGKPQADALMESAAAFIPDKVLFASAHPFVDVEQAVAAFRGLSIPPETLEKILYANGRAFLGL